MNGQFNNYKFIHLLYVPTMACNLKCKYCYLEDNTIDDKCKYSALDTLEFAINKFNNEKVFPFNISLHGGEVTTLNKDDFRTIIKFINDYYNKNRDLILSNGFSIGSPHIKTNLYDLSKHIDTIKEFNVSISGSLDLPLSLHDEYRITKGNKKTLDTILENIKLLNELDNKKKVSSTIFKEHYERIDEIVEDIKYLKNNTCLNMNDFNFMIGFDYNSNGLLHALSKDEQVLFFNRMHEEFDGTDLDEGVNGAWFNEFGPEYCTNCNNCGDKFFLLERNGNIYSCVRGQKHEEFYYGNIYKDSVNDILDNAKKKILAIHNKVGFNEECSKCPYLYLCKTGCPFVKNLYKDNQSYTCKLQQELYKRRNYDKDIFNEFTYDYVSEMHSDLINKYRPLNTGNLSIDKRLIDIINEDSNLKYIYDSSVFILDVDGERYNLESQIIKNNQDIIFLNNDSKINIYVRNDLLDQVCDYPNNNSLYMMLLSGDMISYGDEGRTKQAHIMSHQIYKGVLEKNDSDMDGYFKYDITNLLMEYKDYLSKDNANNLFFTTNSLRDYHYTKQKNNAYYHIQAINLPFQNIEFYFIDMED